MRQKEFGFSFVLEHGKVACYDPDGNKSYVADRLALAYDEATMGFQRLGPPSDIMSWAAGRRRSLREQGLREKADSLAVVLLPRGFDVREYERLLQNEGYFLLFLQKAGII